MEHTFVKVIRKFYPVTKINIFALAKKVCNPRERPCSSHRAEEKTLNTKL